MSRLATDGEGMRCLLVQAGEHICALPLDQVRRVVRALAVRPLPGAAPQLLGLAEFGGEPLAVLDLARLVGAPPGARGSWPVTIVVTAGPPSAREAVGLAADAAIEITELPVEALSGGGGLIRGEALLGERTVRLIDLERLGEEPVERQ
ncbi:MAG: chemotaxis protein CheW [Acidobacteriota bacterium]